MKNKSKGFWLFYDWVDDLDHLDGDSAWKIVRALCDYHRLGKNPIDNVDGALKTVVSIMFHQIKRGEQISEQRAKAGQRGGFATAKNSKATAEPQQKPATYYEETELHTDIQSFTLASAHVREESEDEDDEYISPEMRANLEKHLKDEAKQKYLAGELGKGVVLMSNDQFADLCDELSLDELHKYVGIVAECELSGKHYTNKTHYQAILDMAAQDRRLQTQGGINYDRK